MNDMIDIENDVFEIVAAAVETAHPGTDISDEYEKTPSVLPAVTIREASNTDVMRMRTLTIENAVRVMYEANIYSNKVSGKKEEAKAIANTVDGAFRSIGFTRTFRNPIPNRNDATVYRIVCRYEAVVGPNGDNAFLIYQNY